MSDAHDAAGLQVPHESLPAIPVNSDLPRMRALIQATGVPPYTYRAVIVRTVDADTVVADVDLGFHVWLRGQTLRLVACNAREHDEPGGAEAARHLATLLPVGAVVLLSTVKADKYGGRWDARIGVDGRDVATMLIAEGWAAPWSGRGRKPVPTWPRPTG